MRVNNVRYHKKIAVMTVVQLFFKFLEKQKTEREIQEMKILQALLNERVERIKSLSLG